MPTPGEVTEFLGGGRSPSRMKKNDAPKTHLERTLSRRAAGKPEKSLVWRALARYYPGWSVDVHWPPFPGKRRVPVNEELMTVGRCG